MKRTTRLVSIVGFCAVFLFVVVSTVSAGASTMEEKSQLNLVVAKTETFAEDTTVRIFLENRGKTRVTVLKEFEPRSIFFGFDLVDSHGTRNISSGAGKVDFGAPPKYVTLEPGEFVGIVVPVKDAFKTLEKGNYKLSVEYRNQYGVNCFRGILKSNTIDIAIEASVGQWARE